MGFRANSAERLMQPGPAAPVAGATPWLALFGALLIHAGVLSFLILDHVLEPAIAPVAREILVEIVIEPPPPKPDEPAAKPEPTPPPRPVDLQPAYDAPRAANDEKIERQAPDEATKAAGAPTTAKAPSLNPAPAEAAGPPRQTELHAAENSAAPDRDQADDEDKKMVEANREAPVAQEARADPNAQPEKLPTFVGEPFPAWSTGARFANSDYLPDIELGSAAGPSPVSGGKARSTYLSILYGMIMSHVDSLATSRASSSPREGAIVFTVDAMGKLTQRSIARGSGSPDLDAAALAAVGEAAPFPPPPQGAPMRLRFTYGSK